MRVTFWVRVSRFSTIGVLLESAIRYPRHPARIAAPLAQVYHTGRVAAGNDVQHVIYCASLRPPFRLHVVRYKLSAIAIQCTQLPQHKRQLHDDLDGQSPSGNGRQR